MKISDLSPPQKELLRRLLSLDSDTALKSDSLRSVKLLVRRKLAKPLGNNCFVASAYIRAYMGKADRIERRGHLHLVGGPA